MVLVSAEEMKILAFLFSALAISTVSLKKVPSLRAGRGHNFVRLGATPLLLKNDNSEPALYENMQYRKKTVYNLPIILVRKKGLTYKKNRVPNKVKVAFLKRNKYENLFDEKGMLYLTKRQKTSKRPLRVNSNYDRLFADKGMLQLTKREDEDRNLNKLMKTSVEYKIDDNKKPMKLDFDGLSNILQAINTDDAIETTPRIVYDFAELVA